MLLKSIQKTLTSFYWIFAPLMSVAILALSSIQTPPTLDIGFSFLDKLIHFFLYSFLGIAYFCSFTKGLKKITLLRIVFTLGLAYLFGIFDEYYQSFIPGRQSELGDIIADILGASFGVFLSLKTKSILNKS